jgi:hypothetical protein
VPSVSKYWILIVILLAGAIACKKDTNTSPSQTPFMSANYNNSVISFTSTVKIVASEFTINGTSSGNSTIQIQFGAAGPGTYRLGFGQAIFNSSTGESWQTNNTIDTGAVIISALTANSITGTFSFTGLETKPTLNGSTLDLNSGSFYLTW